MQLFTLPDCILSEGTFSGARDASYICQLVLFSVSFGSGMHRRDDLRGQVGAREQSVHLRAVRDAVPEQTVKGCRKEDLPA